MMDHEEREKEERIHRVEDDNNVLQLEYQLS